jgi:hypothetical protein
LPDIIQKDRGWTPDWTGGKYDGKIKFKCPEGQDALKAFGLTCRAVGCTVGKIVKSLIFKGKQSGKPAGTIKNHEREDCKGKMKNTVSGVL